MKKLLALNRSEIAIRILRAANELGLRTVAIYSKEDRLALHRFKADEAYLIGEGKGPVEAYLDVEGIVALAKEKGVDAIHPGYGFLSENPALPRACERAGITFVGPSAELLDLLGDKTAARRLAQKAGIPRVPGTEEAVTNPKQAAKIAGEIGYPLIIKAAFGGGGRGMRVVDKRGGLRRKAGRGAARIGRRFRQRRSVPGTLRAPREAHRSADSGRPARQHSSPLRARLLGAAPPSEGGGGGARGIARSADSRGTGRRRGDAGARGRLHNAGTVEFLVDADSGEWFFIEVNPRIQVEHTVTEMVTGIDLVRCQIQVAQGLDAARAGNEPAAAGQGAALRLRDAVPHHDGGSGERLRARLRQDSHLSLARGLRHSPGWRLGLFGRGDHAVLRFAAGEDDRLGPRLPARLPAHGPRRSASSACAA